MGNSVGIVLGTSWSEAPGSGDQCNSTQGLWHSGRHTAWHLM